MSENAEAQPQPEALSAATLTSEKAHALLQADLENLEKKVKNGRPLSSSERSLVQSAMLGEKASAVEFAHTIVELAELLGISRKTIQRWRNIEGCPEPRPDGRWHVPSWRMFKIQRTGAGDAGDGEEEVTQAQAKARQIMLKNEELEIRILAKKGDLMPKVMAQQSFSKLILAAKTRCFASISRFVTLARMAENSTVASEEIRKEMTLIWKALEDGEWRK